MKPVTENALVKRINRRLRNNSETLRRCRRGATWLFHDLGRFYIQRTFGFPTAHVDLEAIARDLGVLRPGERIVGAER